MSSKDARIVREMIVRYERTCGASDADRHYVDHSDLKALLELARIGLRTLEAPCEKHPTLRRED